MKIQKRVTAGFLVMVLLFVTIFTGIIPQQISYAASFKGKNLWTGSSEVMFGKPRNYLFRWSDGYQTTFCIDPGHRMNTEVNAFAGRYNINDEFPYIKSKEDFAKLALICDWYDTKAGSISASNASYAAAQGAIWAIMEDGWESADGIISTLDRHIPGTKERWQILKAYVDTSGPGGSNSSLPSWCSTLSTTAPTQTMKLVDGVYKVSLDISKLPELASVPWTFPNSDWSKSVSGNTMTILYKGTVAPSKIEISGTAPASVADSVKKTART